MPDVQGKIEELRREAEAAIGAASDAAELEELRVRYLGRKAELTGILRGIGELPAAERGPVGAGRKRGPAGAGSRALRAAGGARGERARGAGWPPRRST